MSFQYVVVNNLRFDSVRISHGPFMGLPPLTSFVGLGTALALKLESLMGLAQGKSIHNKGVLFAYQHFHMHEGFKKTLKLKKQCTAEAMPARFATFEGSLIFRFELGQEAKGAWEKSFTPQALLKVLSTCKLAKGSICTTQAYLANANSLALKTRFGDNDEARALGALTPSSLVVADYTDLLRVARESSIDPVELLVSLNLPMEKRPRTIRDFLVEHPDIQEADLANASLIPIGSGYLYLEDSASIPSGRQDIFKNTQNARAVSPLYSVVRISHMGSLLKNINPEQPCSYSFWHEKKLPAGIVCTANPL